MKPFALAMVAAALLAVTSPPTVAQSTRDADIRAVTDAINGQRNPATLTPSQMRLFQMVMLRNTRSSCPPVSKKKREAIAAANDYIHCLSQDDPQEDCSIQLRDLKDAGDEVESIVSEIGDRCVED